MDRGREGWSLSSYTTLGDAFTSRASLDMPVTSATATTVDSISYHDVLTM